VSYQATVIQVMIASPGDVTEERNITREVIYAWNDVNSSTSKVVLVPVGWETHSSPELGSRPQELINKRLLKDCDLLIGIFWSRIGTPTGKADSGTIEEIDQHVSAGKPAMIYFSTKKLDKENNNTDQYKKVQSFKDKCKYWGLIGEYENINDFHDKISKQISICLLKNTYINNIINRRADFSNITANNLQNNIEYRLSEEAKNLLKAATLKQDGIILKKNSYLMGKVIQAGGKSFGSKIAKEAAKWESALYELIDNKLATNQGYEEEIFQLTYQGWKIAENIQ